jgi:succinate dehydrogenase / fumarate reductase cytochrome b subunit
MMSITHRATGVALTTGTLVLAVWLVAVALGGEIYSMVAMILAHPLGQFVLFGYSAALIYHAFNGVRHLSWDLGFGLTIPEVYRSGHIVLFLTFLLTACLWLAILA